VACRAHGGDQLFAGLDIRGLCNLRNGQDNGQPEHFFHGCPFRKRHPEITLHYTRFKFPVHAFKFPVPLQKFPVPLSREFRFKSAESLDEWQPLSRNPTQN
jgi:hypothetical protein